MYIRVTVRNIRVRLEEIVFLVIYIAAEIIVTLSPFYGQPLIIQFLRSAIMILGGYVLGYPQIKQFELKWHLGRFLKLLKPTGYVMHQQFNIQQLYVLPTLYVCVLYLSENKQRIVPLTA